MSLNLLLDSYHGSSSDEDSERKEHSISNEEDGEKSPVRNVEATIESEGNTASASGLNSSSAPLKSAFFGSGSDSLSEDSEGDDDHVSRNYSIATTSKDASKSTETVIAQKNLPSAGSLFHQANVKHSVFASLEQKEKMLHEAHLSQHVPLSEKARQEKEERANKRKLQPCKQFLRGRCFRGDKCKFAHVTNETKETPVETKGAVMEVKAEFYKDPNDVFKYGKIKKPRLS